MIECSASSRAYDGDVDKCCLKNSDQKGIWRQPNYYQNQQNPPLIASNCVVVLLLMFAAVFALAVECNPLHDDVDGVTTGELIVDGIGGILWPVEGIDRRARRARRPSLSSIENTSGELGWRKRYYVSRWRGGKPNRRFVPVSSSKSDESLLISSKDETKRLCGLKLTNRTKQLCGECIPTNMRQVILLDKKTENHASSSKDRLTEMCCVQRCTDEQILSFCCRGQT